MGSEDRSRDTYLSEIVHVLFKRKVFILTVFFLVVAGVAIGVLSSSREYEATATIMLTRARSEHVLTPSQGQDGFVSFRMNPTQDLNLETQLLTRRTLLNHVVKTIGSDGVLAGTLPPSMMAEAGYSGSDDSAAANGSTNGNGYTNGHAVTNGSTNGNGLTVISYVRNAANAVTPTFATPLQQIALLVNPKAPIPERDLAVSSLKQALRVTPQENANLIRIAFPADDPRFAGKVLTLLLDQYLEEYPKLRNTPGALEFFEKQMNRYDQELR
jgi:uncharacterized protein involved in exopolysaccharide biosynthesis